MALPSNVTKDYLRSASPDIRKFWDFVAHRAPDNIQARVSEFTSEVSEGKCIFRDNDGAVLFETPDAPPPVKTKSEYGPPAYVLTLEKKVAKDRELGLSNARAVVQVAETVTDLIGRVKALEADLATNLEGNLAAVRDVQEGHHARLKAVETKTTGLQAKADREGRGIFFRGTWQPAMDFESGAIATHKSRAYVAVRSVRAGGEPPDRNGSGWALLFDSKELPRPQMENIADEVVQVIREVTDPIKDRLASLENDIAQLLAQIKN